MFSRPQPEELDASADDAGGQDFLVPGVHPGRAGEELEGGQYGNLYEHLEVLHRSEFPLFSPIIYKLYIYYVVYLGTLAPCQIVRRRFNVQIIVEVLLRYTLSTRILKYYTEVSFPCFPRLFTNYIFTMSYIWVPWHLVK